MNLQAIIAPISLYIDACLLNPCPRGRSLEAPLRTRSITISHGIVSEQSSITDHFWRYVFRYPAYERLYDRDLAKLHLAGPFTAKVPGQCCSRDSDRKGTFQLRLASSSIVGPHIHRPSDTATTLLLRTWSAATMPMCDDDRFMSKETAGLNCDKLSSLSAIVSHDNLMASASVELSFASSYSESRGFLRSMPSETFSRRMTPVAKFLIDGVSSPSAKARARGSTFHNQ